MNTKIPLPLVLLICAVPLLVFVLFFSEPRDQSWNNIGVVLIAFASVLVLINPSQSGSSESSRDNIRILEEKDLVRPFLYFFLGVSVGAAINIGHLAPTLGPMIEYSGKYEFVLWPLLCGTIGLLLGLVLNSLLKKR